MWYSKDNNQIRLTSQSFSSIDKLRDNENNGVVYPFDDKEAFNETLVVSSIIDHHDDERLLKHTESRYAENLNKSRVQYTQIKDTVAYVIDDIQEPKVLDLFKDTDLSYYQSDAPLDLKLIQPFIDTYLNFTTSTDFVLTSNITTNSTIGLPTLVPANYLDFKNDIKSKNHLDRIIKLCKSIV